MHKTHFFIFLFLSFITIPALASSPSASTVLTWQQAVELTRKNNPDLAASLEAIGEAGAQKSIAVSSLAPDIDVNSSLRRSYSSDAARSSAGFSVDGSYLIFDGLNTDYAVLSAEEGIRAARSAYRLNASRIRLDLRKAFCELLRAQELFTLTNDIAKRRGQQLELVRLRYQAGLEHRGSLLTAEANLISAQNELHKVQKSILLNQKKLAHSIGIDPPLPLVATENLVPVTGQKTVPDFNALLEHHPSLQEDLSRVAQAGYAVARAKAGFYPQLRANGSVGTSYMIDESFTDNSNSWSVGLSLSYPLFDGDRRKKEVDLAKSRFRQEKLLQQNNRRSLLIALEEAWTGYTTAIADSKVAETFLRAVRERALIAEKQYASGLINFDTWTIIENDLINTLKNNLNAVINTHIAEAQWLQAQGGALDEEK